MLIVSTCPLCAEPGPAPCDRCLGSLPGAHRPPPVAGVTTLRARFAYEGPTREVVASLKYRNARRVVRRLGAEMAAVVGDVPDVVTWVPAAPVNLRHRGYDQGEVLARRVARCLRVPVRRLLARRGGPQTGSARPDRLVGPDLRVRRRVGGHVLVVDDVVTTGTSLSAAARVLAEAGARRIDAVVLAARADRTFGISRRASGVVPSADRSPYGG